MSHLGHLIEAQDALKVRLRGFLRACQAALRVERWPLGAELSMAGRHARSCTSCTGPQCSRQSSLRALPRRHTPCLRPCFRVYCSPGARLAGLCALCSTLGCLPARLAQLCARPSSEKRKPLPKSRLEQAVDLGLRGGPRHVEHAVRDGRVGERHAHRQAVQLALVYHMTRQ
jgi:hypothetical protein